jgi:hypothetical protein
MPNGSGSKPSSRKGRELKPATVRKRHNIAFRVNDELRARLQSAADAAQRSVSEEIEFQLQRARDLGIILDGILRDGVTADLFKSLSETIRKVRLIADKRGFDEKQTRQALKAAYDHIGEIYFWTGNQITHPPEGYTGQSSVDDSPAAVGYGTAAYAMDWNDDLLNEEFTDGRISNYWSGDGRDTKLVNDAIAQREASVRPLSEIMAGTKKTKRQKSP